MLGFYRKGSFMDWIGLGWVLLVCGRVGVFFCRLYACGVGVFLWRDCGLRDWQKIGEASCCCGKLAFRLL